MLCPDGILLSAKCVTHQSFGRYVGAGVGSGVGAGVGLVVGSGAASEVHAAPSPRSQQSVEPHGATRSGLPGLVWQVAMPHRSAGIGPVTSL